MSVFGWKMSFLQQRATFARLFISHNPSSCFLPHFLPRKLLPPNLPNTPLQSSLPGRRLRRAGDALTGSRWFPVEEPMYVTFVSKAVLWDREVHHTSVRVGSLKRPSMCPRFLSHMRLPPEEDLHPLHFLNSMSMQELPSEEETTKTQSPEGHFQTKDVRGQTAADGPFLPEGERSSEGVRVQTPATPPPSRFHSTPPHKTTPPPDSGNSIPTPVSFHPSCSCSPRRTDESLKEEVLQPTPVKPDSELSLGPAGLMCCMSPSSLSQGSFSLSSRPLSSLFSRSTDLCSSRNSRNTSDFMDSDPEDVDSFSSDQRVKQVSPTSDPPTVSNHRQSLHSPSAAPTPLAESVLSRPEPPSPVQRQRIHSPGEGPHSSTRSSEEADVHTDTPAEASPGGCATPSSPGPCLSPQRSTPHSRLERNFTPSESRLGSHRWPVLPPITPIRGHSSSSSSHCSGFSCSLSHIFDDLEAIAPPSPSCLSLEQPSDSSRSPSPSTELSPGLAAVTVGCDSGDLGSISRVQLLLLDRPIPDAHLSPSELEEGFSPLPDWCDPMVQYDDDTGDWRPLTAGSVSERSYSAARGDTSDWCESPLVSPSSWILEPSSDTLRSSGSPLHPDNDDGNPAEEEPNYQENGDRDLCSDGEQKRPKSPEGRPGQRDRQMGERETKAWSMLSKLQENTPQQSSSSTSRSNFEDFDFLAKYCIFSQEKLAEYKRAFEAEDRSGDGYISSLQVLLALKTIIPEEHLSEEEEIYVYRILEMVDFKVTDGLVDLRLFAVIASLAQKIASMDEFMRSLISSMDFRSLEVRLFKAKRALATQTPCMEMREGSQRREKGSFSLFRDWNWP
ncbi:proline-rich protein 36 isoform X2 [Oryzias melastigma]|uniref:proline-rich protein 36 isoform X2 n=1 Tax=Oryzias melastigma TaxID=30732 RepID=UPI00168CE99F|nr:proline-rich protein 36 isoform X2 [Oryzias melastigma]